MFREIENCIRRSGPNSESEAKEHNRSFGIETYGISVTTLEEVFLRVAGCDINKAECIEDKKTLLVSDSIVSQASDDCAPRNIVPLKVSGKYKVIEIIVTVMRRALSFLVDTVQSFLNFVSMLCCCCCCYFLVRSTFWEHSKALFLKRAISAQRDRRTIVFQLVIPAVFLFFGLLFLQLKPHPDQQSVTLTTSYFNPLLSGGGGDAPIPFDLRRPISNKVCCLRLHFLLSSHIKN